MKIDEKNVGDVMVLRLSGRFTLGDATYDFEKKIDDLIRRNFFKVLVDLVNISYIDASGIGQLVSAFTKVTNRRGGLKILMLEGRAKDLLVATGLYTVFETFDDLAVAVMSFR
jgi:anti-sigma B factor antagonist